MLAPDIVASLARTLTAPALSQSQTEQTLLGHTNFTLTGRQKQGSCWAAGLSTPKTAIRRLTTLVNNHTSKPDPACCRAQEDSCCCVLGTLPPCLIAAAPPRPPAAQRPPHRAVLCHGLLQPTSLLWPQEPLPVRSLIFHTLCA